MPPFNFYRRRPWQRWWRRRRRFRTRRFRNPIFRRFRRRNWVRRRRYKKTIFKKKAKKVTVKEWQPLNIRKCRIKGNLCLLSCGRLRANQNYTLFSESYVPIEESGGGGWSIMQLTLRALYDEYQKYRNWWTKSNQGLPLVKFINLKLKFYRSAQTDYLIQIKRCPPFEVTRDIYFNTQPSRMLMNHKTIIVPRLDRPFSKKPYIKRTVLPPSLFQSKWYFQQDILNTPLVVLYTSSCSLDQMYGPSDQLSYNITLKCLNTDFFQNPAWKQESDTGYTPKVSGTITQKLFTTGNGSEPTKWNELIPLFNTRTYTLGKPIQNKDSFNNKDFWGNPFAAKYIHDDVRYYYGPIPNNIDNKPNVTLLHELYFYARYNPMKDNGQGNKVYMKSTSLPQGSFLTLPKEDIIASELPLWIIMWAWESWLNKAKPIQHIQDDYQLVIQTQFFYPKRQAYVILDRYFANTSGEDLTETDKANWHPKTEFQEESIAYIANTGPATPKFNNYKSIEAHCGYNFLLKWGGCPAPMEIIEDPAKQEKFPFPNNIQQTSEIQDPATQKQHYLYYWDQRADELTGPATKRLKQDFTFDPSFAESGPKELPNKRETQEEEDETSIPKNEEETSILIQQLRYNQRQLRNRIRHLLKNPKLFPIK